MGLCEFHAIQGMRPHLKLRYVPYYFTQYILPKDQAQKMVESQKHDKDVKLHENPNKCLNILDEQMDSLMTVYNYATPGNAKRSLQATKQVLEESWMMATAIPVSIVNTRVQ